MSERATLLTLLDQPHAFAERLANSLWFESDFLHLLGLLQSRPDLFDALRAKLPAYRRDLPDVWGPRTLWSEARINHEAFVQKANDVARTLDPSFPTLELKLDSLWTGYCATGRGHDARVEGRGWKLDVDERDVGPAEVFHEEDWLAVAHGLGGAPARLEVGCYDRGTLVLCWWQHHVR